MKDRKAAKKLIKRAKEHPDWYPVNEVWYAKMIKKINDERKINKRNSRRRKNDGVHSESEQPKQPDKSSRGWFVRLLHQARSLVGL
tara:strand:+ start:252 stop:509 length:258 start_codon:yes stop_codon:yes gene_type:complete